jgi:hypothetical protein
MPSCVYESAHEAATAKQLMCNSWGCLPELLLQTLPLAALAATAG